MKYDITLLNCGVDFVVVSHGLAAWELLSRILYLMNLICSTGQALLIIIANIQIKGRLIAVEYVDPIV